MREMGRRKRRLGQGREQSRRERRLGGRCVRLSTALEGSKGRWGGSPGQGG